jgi:hypothetical protein
LPAKARFFKPNKCFDFTQIAPAELAAAFAEQLLLPGQRMRRDGLEIVVLRGPVQQAAETAVSATIVMMSPGRRGAYETAKLRMEMRRTASMVSSTE